jgi:hypothetical protein
MYIIVKRNSWTSGVLILLLWDYGFGRGHNDWWGEGGIMTGGAKGAKVPQILVCKIRYK